MYFLINLYRWSQKARWGRFHLPISCSWTTDASPWWPLPRRPTPRQRWVQLCCLDAGTFTVLWTEMMHFLTRCLRFWCSVSLTVHCRFWCSPLSVWLPLFRGAGREKRRGEQLKWPLAIGCISEVFPVHSCQDEFIQPGWAESFVLL